jgi:hypothetical protein
MFGDYLLLVYNWKLKGYIQSTEDGSMEAILQILYDQYLILGVFGSYMF